MNWPRMLLENHKAFGLCKVCVILATRGILYCGYWQNETGNANRQHANAPLCFDENVSKRKLHSTLFLYSTVGGFVQVRTYFSDQKWFPDHPDASTKITVSYST